MNKKEISEIKRCLKFERNNIQKIVGCYVNASGSIITKFTKSFGLMPQDEAEKYISIFKKSLGGSINRNIRSIYFPSGNEKIAEKHKLLTSIKNSELNDEANINILFDTISKSIVYEDNYVILLALNKYDVPYKAKDEEEIEDYSTETFTFLLCSICPVKANKSSLVYSPENKDFINDSGDNSISTPDIAFMFPSFDERQANINAVEFYTKNIGESYETLTDNLFGNSIKMNAKAENQSFKEVLAETLDKDCSLNVAKRLRSEIATKNEEHKVQNDPNPVVISRNEIVDILTDCGISQDKLDKFENRYNETFGAATEITAKNIVNQSKAELRTPDIVIKVPSERLSDVEVKIINGAKYIIIRADDGVELDGLNLSFEN